jgi:hypothetical protein
MVDTTALELQQDLGDLPVGSLASAAAGLTPGSHELAERVRLLELQVGRHREAFFRLLDLPSRPSAVKESAS